jgi:hypothetical protein
MALDFEADINPLVSLYLNDDEVRWDKPNRVIWLNDAVKKIRYMRADSTLDEWEEVAYAPYTIASPANIILAEIFLEDVVNYIVWKCYAQDSQDDFNFKLAETWQATFMRGIK